MMWQLLFCVWVMLAFAVSAPAQITGFAAADAISRDNRLRSESLVASGVDVGTGAFIFEPALMQVDGGREIIFMATYNSLLQ